MDDSPDPAFPGQTVLFSIMVTNFGPATATSVRVTNVLPAAYQYLPSSTVSQGTISANGQTVIASLGNLGANAVATIALRTRAVDAGTYTNAASSGSLDVDPFKGNNLVSVKSVIEPNLLTTTAVGNTLVISYPNVAGYILQTAASLTPPVVWSPVNTAGAPVVNGYKQVTIPMTGAGNFYRVVAP
jgi:uncharacterized repeat protein (TIGR01451 family)